MRSQALLSADDFLRPSLDDASADTCFDLLTARACATPHERLMLTLLLDAVIQLQRRGTMSAAAAARWVRGEKGMGGETTSFRAACAALHIDADHLARGLLRAAETRTPVMPIRAPRLASRPRQARHSPPHGALRHHPLLRLWMLFLAAVVAAPLWARVAMGVGLAVVCVAVGQLLVP